MDIKTTAEERAEAINAIVLAMDDMLGQLEKAKAQGFPVPRNAMLAVRTEDLYLLLDELKQAKLDRARLALMIN